MTPFVKGVAYAITSALCWAVLAIALKYTLTFTTTGSIVWVRMLVAFVVLFSIYAVRYPTLLKKIFWPPPWQVLVAGVFLACNYFGYLKGLSLTSASHAQIMIQIGPLCLLFAGVFYFKERVRLVQWFGVVVAASGFCLFNLEQLRASLGQQEIYIIGNIWIIAAAVTWTLFAVLQKLQLKKGWTPQMINLLIYAVCSLILLPAADVSQLSLLNGWQWIILFFLGINTLIAYGAFGEAMRLIPASYVSLIITVNPLLTLILMSLFTYFDFTFISPEPLKWSGYLGALLVIFGVAIAVSLKPKAESEPA